MKVLDAPTDGFRGLFRAVSQTLSATGIGLVQQGDDGLLALTYVDVFGATGYRARIDDVPRAFRPGNTESVRSSAAELEQRPDSLISSRLLHIGLSDAVREPHRPRQIVTVPVPGLDGRALFIAGLLNDGHPSVGDLSALESFSERVGGLLREPESPGEELDRLRRMAAVESVLPSLFRIPDVPGIFGRLSSITKEMLRHDFASLGIFSEDLKQIDLYVQTNPESPPRARPTPYPPVQTAAWLYRFLDDLSANPVERDRPSAQQGGRSSLRVAVRIDEHVLGALDFTSTELKPYAATDLVIARQIASYVALALSHQRMAEDSRRVATLRERAANLEMLSGLLTTLTGVLDIRDVFDRVSQIAQSVLPHDALSLGERSDDGNRVTVHCSQGLGPLPTPYQIDTTERRLLNDPRDFKIIDDLRERPDHATSPGIRAGMRSMLVVSIRVEGRQYGGLTFYAKEPRRFVPDDVLVAGRIADHVALALSHQRLAEQEKQTQDLRARTTNLELLDELLAALTDSVELREVFERVSAIARKVLPHDALMLPVVLPDGRHFRRYASTGVDPVGIEDIIEIPKNYLNAHEWEDEVIADVVGRDGDHNARVVSLGFRSVMRIPIRLDKTFAGLLVFLGKAVSAFKQEDILVARRIADRIAVALAQDREVQALRRADEATQRASKLESRVRELTEELDARTGYRRVVGESKEWRQVLTQATQVSATDATVLLLGESGTGKEVVARFVHRASQRAGGPFLALNCAALPEQLLEAELFGYERGAFTGAMQSKPGQLEQASGGTLFLDEVGEMSLAAQAKFLRVLQEREFQRIGGTRVLKTDARIVAATNRDLERAIGQGQFREDLYYRLNVFAIQLPALRERRDDVLPLSEAFLVEIGRGLGRPPAGISRDARQLLTDYHWPGNVRELRNILERAAILCEGGLITADHLALKVARPAAAVSKPAPAAAPLPAIPSEPEPLPPPQAGDLQSLERGMIEQALRNARFNKSKAAKALGLTRTQLYVRMRKYGLE